jgi:predicted HicB family RNase H-like nuclease
MPRLNIDIPDTLHKLAKSQASLQGITLKEYVIDSLNERVKHGNV